MKKKIVAMSDMHGQLPINVPEADLCIIAGDICPISDHSKMSQVKWLMYTFGPWLRKLPVSKIVYIAGNHDFVYEEKNKEPNCLQYLHLTKYLMDSGCEWEGLKIWGTPWQPYFYGWAFNLYESDLAKKFNLIPIDTDILITHGPPKGYLDLVTSRVKATNEEKWPEPEHVGSVALIERYEQIKPRLHVFGHIHAGRGVCKLGETLLANVVIVDESYRNVYEPMVFEIDTETKDCQCLEQ